MLCRLLCGSVSLDELVRGVFAPVDTVRIFGACSFVLVEKPSKFACSRQFGKFKETEGLYECL